MSELPPDAAALLARARHAHGPQQADRERVLHGLHATLGISAAAAIAATTATTAASATAAAVAEGGSIAPAAGGALGWKSALLTWKAGKVMLATVAIGGAVGVGSATLPARQPAPAQHSAEIARASRRAAPPPSHEEERVEASAPNVATRSTAREPVAPTPPRSAARAAAMESSARELPRGTQAARVDGAEPEDEARAPERGTTTTAMAAATATRASRASEPQRSERRTRRERRAQKSRGLAGAPRESTVRKEQPSSDGRSGSAVLVELDDGASRGEAALLRSALASVRDGDGQQALSLLAEHAARYPSGAFSTERRGLRVLALCAAGMSAEGQREQAAFLREAGGSPIAARVRSACTERTP